MTGRFKTLAKHYVPGTVVVLILFALLALSLPARAQTLTVLHTFGPWTSGNGVIPVGGVFLDKAGNVYGTTDWGGNLACNAPFGCGSVFTVNPAGHASVLLNFSGPANINAPYPNTRVGVRDSAGNLYGTTRNYGTSNAGTVFKLTPSGHETVLYNFAGSTNGGNPDASVIRDSAGNLYGTTVAGGSASCNVGWGCGLVFKVDAHGKETVLYRFRGGSDGWYPVAPLYRDTTGNLYGSTYFGGVYDRGTLFKVDTTGKETVLHSFNGGIDGAYPAWGLIPCGSGGQLCGATGFGGAYGFGVVFKWDATNQETPLYSFTGGADGFGPQTRLIRDTAGNLYGVTQAGGAYGNGTVFEVTPTGQETVLYSFTGGSDGGTPAGQVARDSAGNLYGSTSHGGDVTCNAPYGCGVVFKLTP